MVVIRWFISPLRQWYQRTDSPYWSSYISYSASWESLPRDVKCKLSLLFSVQFWKWNIGSRNKGKTDCVITRSPSCSILNISDAITCGSQFVLLCPSQSFSSLARLMCCFQIFSWREEVWKRRSKGIDQCNIRERRLTLPSNWHLPWIFNNKQTEYIQLFLSSNTSGIPWFELIKKIKLTISFLLEKKQYCASKKQTSYYKCNQNFSILDLFIVYVLVAPRQIYILLKEISA